MRILKDSFIYLIGELFAKSLPFLLPYLTREGQKALVNYRIDTWLALFGIFIGLSQEGAVTRYFYFYGRKGLNTVVTGLFIQCCDFSNTAFRLLVFKLKSWHILYSPCFSLFINVQLTLRQCQQQPIKYITSSNYYFIFNERYFTIAALESYLVKIWLRIVFLR